VIADIAIAVRNAALRRGWDNGGEPTAVINTARKGGSIIATGSGNTAGSSKAGVRLDGAGENNRA
jgi:hypothetical protein